MEFIVAVPKQNQKQKKQKKKQKNKKKKNKATLRGALLPQTPFQGNMNVGPHLKHA